MSAQKKTAKKKATVAPKKTLRSPRAAKRAAATKAPAKKAAKRAARRPKPATDSNAASPDRWNLRLYVAGQTPKSLSAFANLKQLCEEHLSGRYHIEVIDLLEQPQLAAGDQIVAIPTLVRKLPAPIKRIIGNLSNLERVMVGMDLQPYDDS